ncbi:MAG: hypothetical protein ACTMIR_13830 [Cellulomonadaceae bacterium]
MDREHTTDLPRAVTLALWLAAVADGRADADQAVTAVRGEDEPHSVADEDLRVVVRRWTLPGPQPLCVAAALPAPGDATGLPAPLSALALEAGECVLLSRDGHELALVPRVERFGSAWEPGHIVTWQTCEAPRWQTRLLGAVGTLAEADRELRSALRPATEARVGHERARRREDAVQAITRLGRDGGERWDVPDGLPARRLHVLSAAARLRAIVAIATSDDGGAINLWQADQRATALREVDRVARRALSAASYAPASTER